MMRDIGECFGDGPEGTGPDDADAQCAGAFYNGEHHGECPQRDACERDYEQRQEKLQEEEERRAEAAGFSRFYEPPPNPRGQFGLNVPGVERTSRRPEPRLVSISQKRSGASMYSPDDTHSYLAVDEPPPEDGEWRAHLVAIVARTMFKAACLSLAHFFNNHPFRRAKRKSPDA